VACALTPWAVGVQWKLTAPSVSASAVSGGGRFRHPQPNKTGRPPTTTASPLSPTSQCPLRALAPHPIRRANYPKASCFPNGGNRRLTLSCRIPDSYESVGSFPGCVWIWLGGGAEPGSDLWCIPVGEFMVGYMEWPHDWLLWDAFLECGGIRRPPIR
jgi:hypothetical protein